MRLTAAGVLWASVTLGAVAQPQPQVAELVLLSQAATEEGAVCLDGSPSAYYIYRGAETRKWIIHQNGGGWCSSPIDCAQRSNTTLGTSRFFPPTTPMSNYSYLDNEGYTRTNATENPLMYNWTIVDLMYCDGSSQTSDLTAPMVVPGWPAPIYHRGARILRATIASLLAAGLANATDVVVSGCSAGGLSTYLHADKWAAALKPSGARVAALADSGFFLDYNSSSSLTYPQRMQWTYDTLNISASLYPECLALYPGSEGWRCFMAQYAAPHIRTPLFEIQSYFDSYQIGAIADVNATNNSAVNAYGDLLKAAVSASQAANPRIGGAIDACHHHCSRNLWYTMSVGQEGGVNVSEGDAFARWYAEQGRGQQVWEQQAEYPCASCCGGAVCRS